MSLFVLFLFGNLKLGGNFLLPTCRSNKGLAWPPLQILAVKEQVLLVQILGSETFLEKCR